MGPQYNTHFENMYRVWIAQLKAILPPGTDIPAAYLHGSGEEQDFVQNLALFLTAYLKARAGCLLRCAESEALPARGSVMHPAFMALRGEPWGACK